MLLTSTYINSPKVYVEKPLFVEWRDWCTKIAPPPFFCEIPDELKVRSVGYNGTSQTYTYTSSMASLASVGTSTTTI